MKLKQIFLEILAERKQVGKVYHFTTLRNAVFIVKTNLIKATEATRNIRGETVSTTRDKNFSKNRSGPIQISGADVAFVLNGDSLSDRYEVRPYDDSYSTTDKEYDASDKLEFGDEQEELWYGKKLESDGGFANIKKYTFSILFSKRFKKALVSDPTNFRQHRDIIDIFPNLLDVNASPIEEMNEIKSWFESNGFRVEFEK